MIVKLALREFALLVEFPRKRKTFLDRPNHFIKWREEQFFQRFRLSKNTVRFILELINDRISSSTDRNNAILAEEKLLLTLRYYATGSFLAVCGDFIGVHKSSASNIIQKVSHELALLKSHYLNLPNTNEEVHAVKQEFYNICGFPKCIGAIDCTHVRIKSPGGDNAEIYRNRKGYFSINVQTVVDSNLRIQNIVCSWPGSSHDATIFNHSVIKGRFDRGEMGDGIIVGDSRYPLKKYLMTPFQNVNTEGQNLYNEAQIRTRNPVERCYGVWKKRFPILAIGINLKLDRVESVIVATAVLHNIACHFGERIPRVTRGLENAINLTSFSTGAAETSDDDGKKMRTSLVAFFES